MYCFHDFPTQVGIVMWAIGGLFLEIHMELLYRMRPPSEFLFCTRGCDQFLYENKMYRVIEQAALCTRVQGQNLVGVLSL